MFILINLFSSSSMRHDLNSAAKAIANSFGASIGIRRTYGGGDDCNRMHISWQMVVYGRIIGMIDLICEDGLGSDGMQWHGSVRVTGPGVDFEDQLIGQWHQLYGRRAKLITRRKFFTGIDTIIRKIHDPRLLQDRRRENMSRIYRSRASIVHM